jgi:hypothetical protein
MPGAAKQTQSALCRQLRKQLHRIGDAPDQLSDIRSHTRLRAPADELALGLGALPPAPADIGSLAAAAKRIAAAGGAGAAALDAAVPLWRVLVAQPPNAAAYAQLRAMDAPEALPQGTDAAGKQGMQHSMALMRSCNLVISGQMETGGGGGSSSSAAAAAPGYKLDRAIIAKLTSVRSTLSLKLGDWVRPAVEGATDGAGGSVNLAAALAALQERIAGERTEVQERISNVTLPLWLKSFYSRIARLWGYGDGDPASRATAKVAPAAGLDALFCVPVMFRGMVEAHAENPASHLTRDREASEKALAAEAFEEAAAGASL